MYMIKFTFIYIFCILFNLIFKIIWLAVKLYAGMLHHRLNDKPE